MTEQDKTAQDHEITKAIRSLAADGDWAAFAELLTPGLPTACAMAARTALRTHLKGAEPGKADAIVRSLTPEALLALDLPLKEARSFVEALLHASDTDEIEKLFEAAADIAPESPVVAALRLRLLGRIGKPNAIQAVIRGPHGHFGRPELLLEASDYLRLKPWEHEELIEFIEDLPAGSTDQLRLQGIRWLYRVGEIDRAERIARRYRGNADASRFDGVLSILTHLPARSSRLAPSKDAPEIAVGHSPSDKAAIIFFSGFATPGRNTGEGGVMDRYIGDLGLTMIGVRDHTHLLYLRGIPGVADTISESAAVLKEIVKSLGLETIYTMGGSAGGFPAVVYGLHLEAEAALLFGSPTDCGPGNAHIDTRAQIVARKLQRNFDNETLDMITWLDAFDYPLPITMYYSAHNAVDAWHAERIADRPNVRSIAMGGEGSHHAMVEASRNRVLGQVIAEGLSLPWIDAGRR